MKKIEILFVENFDFFFVENDLVAHLVDGMAVLGPGDGGRGAPPHQAHHLGSAALSGAYQSLGGECTAII